MPTTILMAVFFPFQVCGNHKITAWLRLDTTSGDHCSNPLLEQGCLQAVAQDHVLADFEYPQGWRVHNLSVEPVPVAGHSPSVSWCSNGTFQVSRVMRYLWSVLRCAHNDALTALLDGVFEYSEVLYKCEEVLQNTVSMAFDMVPLSNVGQ